MQVRLKVTQGSKAGSEIKIPAPKCLIGRSDECHLRPQSEAISRRHCVIITTESEVAVRDLGSRNGTFVNDERINEEAVLLQGDILRVGPLEFEVQLEQSVSKQKRPKANDIASVAARSAEGSKAGANTTELGSVGDWLEEADNQLREKRFADPETRQFKIEETSAAQPAVEAGTDPGTDPGIPKDSETKSIDSPLKKPDKKSPGKLPPREEAQKKDSREAAADMLKKFFNRR